MAREVRITGLVRTAGQVRAELAAPLSRQGRDRLRARVEQILAQADQIARAAGTRVDRLPGPSRRAIQFLRTVPWDEVPVTDQPEPPARTGGVHWPGLRDFARRAMEQLSDQVDDDAAADAVLVSIARMHRQIEGTIEREQIAPDQLAPVARALRGWLALLVRPDGMAAYRGALRRARHAMEPAMVRQRRFPPPLRIQFRPMQGIYKLRAERGGAGGSVLALPTPMLAFDAEAFTDLADLIFRRQRGASRRRVIDRLTAPDAERLRAQLEGWSGIVEQARGAFHDLAAAFDRVNAACFGGSMPRPRLTWSQSFTGRKFGHYDWIHDTVMVTRTLDAHDVPAYVVDFLVYHELLHKRHGIRWSDERGYAHTPEFRREERAFAQYAEAEAVLDQLARGQRPRPPESAPAAAPSTGTTPATPADTPPPAAARSPHDP